MSMPEEIMANFTTGRNCYWNKKVAVFGGMPAVGLAISFEKFQHALLSVLKDRGHGHGLALGACRFPRKMVPAK